MSINTLYCEGAGKSPDIRVLRNILPERLEIKPVGSKYGLDKRILFVKQNIKTSPIAALKDRDFDDDTSVPASHPRDWNAKDESQREIRVGWSWERKEIENYIIDPDIVLLALGDKAPPIDKYREVLHNSAKLISHYTAARIALSLSRPNFRGLSNYWGDAGSKKHPFPARLSELDCRTGLREVVQKYEQVKKVSESDVLEVFEKILPTCLMDGVRFRYFLTFFSGKDLLWGMKDGLIDLGFRGEPFDFPERVLKGIETSTDKISDWLPEWKKLRELVQSDLS